MQKKSVGRRLAGITLLSALLPVLLPGWPVPAAAAPFRPESDAQVLERVPARLADPRTREIEALRAAAQREPQDVDRAVTLARRLYEEALAQGDPRFIGHAQAALGTWWTDPAAPESVLVQRAKLLQYGHRFDDALVDLEAAIRLEPRDLEAFATRAAIRMVRADYAGARSDCEAYARFSTALLGTACVAYADSMRGRIDDAARAIEAALKAAPRDTDPDALLWVLTRAAEIDERRGAFAQAEVAFRRAVALGEPDVYLLSAYADFLLDRGRAADALALLTQKRSGSEDPARADVLLLRMALAGKATNDPRAEGWARELAARFEAARARGDATHAKEESRFVLAVPGDAKRALQLARANFEVQREVADARALLEAALAARDTAGAAPALDWMRTHGVQSVVLDDLRKRIEALR